MAGSVNLGAPVTMQVQRVGADTRHEAIVAMMRDAMSQRPALARVADRWAGPFLWAVLVLAALAAAAWSVIDPSRAVWVAVSVLIVTCPCALSLAVPAALVAAAGGLARRGVLVQRLDALESMARLERLFIDKTGTLTTQAAAVAAGAHRLCRTRRWQSPADSIGGGRVAGGVVAGIPCREALAAAAGPAPPWVVDAGRGTGRARAARPRPGGHELAAGLRARGRALQHSPAMPRRRTRAAAVWLCADDGGCAAFELRRGAARRRGRSDGRCCARRATS